MVFSCKVLLLNERIICEQGMWYDDISDMMLRTDRETKKWEYEKLWSKKCTYFLNVLKRTSFFYICTDPRAFPIDFPHGRSIVSVFLELKKFDKGISQSRLICENQDDHMKIAFWIVRSIIRLMS